MLYLYMVKEGDEYMLLDITVYCSDPGLGIILQILSFYLKLKKKKKKNCLKKKQIEED